ncbi:MAG: VWA domain-containing protein [Phycisphaerales bacterium]
MIRRFTLAAVGILGTTLTAAAQVVDHPDHCLIVPQARHTVWHPHPRSAPVISVTSVSTDVTVIDQVATTTMVMVLANAGGAPQEAQVLVPVPEGASVRAFGLDSVGPEPTAKLLPREEARRIYNDIVSKMRDPGLLEFAGQGLIRSSVFPIPAHGTNTVRLTYEQLLTADSDRVDYVLPRTDSTQSSGVKWTLSMDIRCKRPISTVYSPSHELVTERKDANHVVVRASAESASNPGSFRVSYLMQALEKEGVSFSILTYPDPEVGPEGGYFLLLTGLPAKTPDETQGLKREVTIVIDRSGSMRGEKMEQAREALLQVVEGLDEGDFFNIIDYSDSIEMFSEQPVRKMGSSIERARAYIKALKANGGTNIHDALLEALRQRPTPGTLPVVLFLTDGLPTVGQTSEVAIREAAKAANAAGRRVFTFGVGFDVNGPLLTGIARSTRAASTFVLPEENVEVKVGQVFRRLSGPVLDTPKLTAIVDARGGVVPRPIRELQPGVLPDMFEGDQLVVLGQYTDASAKRLVLEGNYLGKARSFEFQFDAAKATTRNSFVPRLWASRKIASLIEEIRQAGATSGALGAPAPPSDPRTKELVEEIVRLSIKWGILTEYTAFLATEMTVSDGRRDEAGYAMPGRRLSFPAAPATDAPMAAGEGLRVRAAGERQGKMAVNQELNLGAQIEIGCENKLNMWIDKDMNYVQVQSVCQVGDRTLFRRGTRWVDAAILDKEGEAPEATIEFASAEYFKLAEDLSKENRQGLLAQGGDVYLLVKAQRVLVKGPAGN